MTTKIRLLHDTVGIPTGAVAVTQSASDNTTKVATTAYVTTALANLADSAPSTLNTLNELAAALGDDANFSTTVTNSIATKLPLAGGTLTGNLTGTQAFFSPNTAGKNTITLTTNASDDGRILIKSNTTDKVDIQANGTSYFNGGNVGIGTTSPASKLSTVGTIRSEGMSTITGGGAGTEVRYDVSGGYGGILAYDRGNSAYKELRVEGSIIKFKESGTDIMTIDGNKVGIGTTSPMSQLHVNKNVAGHNTDGITLGKVEASGWIDANEEMGRLSWAASYGSSYTQGIGAYISAKADANWDGTETPTRLGFFTAPEGSTTPVERMRIDSSGNVAIGSTTAALANMSGIFRTLDSTGGDRTVAHFGAHNYGDTGKTFINIGCEYGDGTSRIGSFNDTGNSSVLVFDTHSATSGQFTERMRINSAGTLLVGTSDGTGTGLEISKIHGVRSTVTNNVAFLFNRLSSDGHIGLFRKDGTTVGSIASAGGDLVVGSHNTCFRFDDSADDILPTDDAGLLVDNTLVLGASNARFKEIYLSNGINFSANANASGMSSEILDDYEEGVFDAAITPGSGSYTLNSAYSKLGYTRIGRVVTITGMVVISGASGASGSVTIGDLPFEMLNGTQRSSQTRPSIHIYANGSGAPASAYYSAFIAFNEGNRSGTLIVTHNNTHDATPGDWLAGGSDLFINFSYHAAD